MALKESLELRRTFARRIASQGALLFSGFAAAQVCSFLRNAILGHVLAKGDFGIAATLTMVLQLIENMTDIGADRLIVSSPGGAAPRFMATAHAVLIARGFLTALVLYVIAGPFCRFLDIAHAIPAFELIALVPLIKGLTHLDMRRAQRDLENRPQMLVEVLPQLLALGLTFPILAFAPSYGAVAGLALAQAVAGVVTSHAVARHEYAIAADGFILRSLVAFGWPIWLSAFPLMAVYQGDRLLIGKLYGMDALASYSVAFLMTMVPALIAAKVGQSLMLPLLASQRDAPRAFASRYDSLSSLSAVAAALYLIVMGVAGGAIVPLAFGAQYAGLGTLTGWLALMWTVRMVQVVPGMAVMAHGETRPFLVAGLIRAASLPLALALALNGSPLETLAAAGTAGELASFIYIVWRAGQLNAGLPALSRQSNVWLGGVAVAVALTSQGLMGNGPSEHMAAVLLLAACATGYAVTAQTTLRDGIATLIPLSRSTAGAQHLELQ